MSLVDVPFRLFVEVEERHVVDVHITVVVLLHHGTKTVVGPCLDESAVPTGKFRHKMVVGIQIVDITYAGRLLFFEDGE